MSSPHQESDAALLAWMSANQFELHNALALAHDCEQGAFLVSTLLLYFCTTPVDAQLCHGTTDEKLVVRLVLPSQALQAVT